MFEVRSSISISQAFKCRQRPKVIPPHDAADLAPFNAMLSEMQAIHFLACSLGHASLCGMWAAFSICILSPPHGRRWINHGFEIGFKACLQLRGFVGVRREQITLFGDIINDIEESG